jgi:hypothetical protein
MEAFNLLPDPQTVGFINYCGCRIDAAVKIIGRKRAEKVY